MRRSVGTCDARPRTLDRAVDGSTVPELPEVETVRRGLEPYLEGARIEKVTLNRKDLRFPFPRASSRPSRARPSSASAGARSTSCSGSRAARPG